MRILYGVQATGQGHISRARAMAEALEQHDVEVQWLFSGRPRERLFDMEPFGDYLHRRGLSFATRQGRISYVGTLTSQNLPAAIAEVIRLDVRDYDFIVTDYEPVSAWAGRLRGVRTLGIGHQYAFGPGTPLTGDAWHSRLVMRHFAPVDEALGLHWHPFNGKVLPPLLDLPEQTGEMNDHVVVYLPFEDQQRVSDWLQQFSAQRFIQFSADLDDEEHGNVLRRRANIKHFKQALWSSRGVICNSGFELVSECLQWRKPVLTKPLAGQLEQLSNALALETLDYARTMHSLDDRVTAQWLAAMPEAPDVHFGDVASVLAAWLAAGAKEAVETLGARLWRPRQFARFDSVIDGGAPNAAISSRRPPQSRSGNAPLSGNGAGTPRSVAGRRTGLCELPRG
ncbi:MAG: MJ1255/VC2487 family glycosyltransferase [Pseudomonadota bacterium]